MVHDAFHLILMIQGPPVGSLSGLTGSVTDCKLPVSHAVTFNDDSVTAKKHAHLFKWRVMNGGGGPDGASMPCRFTSRR